jgi:hypothetical protein
VFAAPPPATTKISADVCDPELKVPVEVNVFVVELPKLGSCVGPIIPPFDIA